MPDNNKALGKKFSVYFNLIQYFAIPTTSEVIIANILKQTIVFRLPCLVAQKNFKIARKPLLLYWLYSALVKYFWLTTTVHLLTLFCSSIPMFQCIVA